MSGSINSLFIEDHPDIKNTLLSVTNVENRTRWMFLKNELEKLDIQITGFSSDGILRRLNRLQILNEISTDLRSTFRFPREENNRLGISSDAVLKFDEIPSTEKILHILNTAKNDALNIAVELGMNMDEEKIKESFEMIKIRHFTDEKKDNEEENNDNIIQEQNNDNWPKKDDVQEVDKRFVIHGPITLDGTNPFTINKEVRAEIQKKFKKFKNN
ncbi:hypothetical protein ALC62_01010 [Cyphomyrmex costatus]|uniref:Uncharacterized protein n=1 Tax=Cyphomyrmex costatus TaxID=456900 RepID=A0A151IPT1_9HYME|nr:hypothetical protein ALC62_01010 [Cyphomyrmex costatus]